MALAELVPGTIFARDYVIESLVAQGGMGAVYRAEQRSTGSTVALKIMLPDLLTDAKSRERFEHEARVSSRIRSSHVVKVLAAGIDEPTQTPWLAMEFLDGQNLADYLSPRGSLAPDLVLAVLRQVGHALSAAHAAGVVHCDLKPENIFIAPSQTEGVPFDVKVLDFGIARLLKEGRQSATVTTAVGSPHWLAPEQGVKGKTVSPATDVWAFGLIAFRLLTGRFYWLNANVPDEECNVYALLGEIAGKDQSVAASDRLRALGETRALLPAGFDAWFARCVSRDVTARIAEAADAVAGLSAVLRTTGPIAATRFALPSIQQGPAHPRTVGAAGPAVPGHSASGIDASPHTVSTKSGSAEPILRRNRLLVIGVGALLALTALGFFERDRGTLAAWRFKPVALGYPGPEGMVGVIGGTFHMSHAPQRTVAVQSFWIDQTEVTTEAYFRGRAARALTAGGGPDGACNALISGHDNHPINCIQWTEAEEYCRSRGARLPTEEEWEYARGGEVRRIPRSDSVGVSVYSAPNRPGLLRRTFPGGTFPAGATGATPDGILGRSGNVWEMTSTAFARDAMVIRGGAWSGYSDPMQRTGIAQSGYRSDSIGFRCARDN